METWKDLKNLSPDEITKFLDSFDTILTDCDGVLWHLRTPIPGALEALKRLQELGKRVIFVSNNSTIEVDQYVEKLKKMGFDASPDQIVIPSIVISWHLRKINFEGKAYVIGAQAIRKVLSEDGIKVVTGPNVVNESIDTLKNLVELDPAVKAVVFDFDINTNWPKLFQASLYLEQDDVLFLTGALDRNLPISQNQTLLGIGQFADILMERTGKKPIECAKPSEVLKNYLIEHYGVEDSKRCIFVGDSLASDMKFAKYTGFWQLWVGTGTDTPQSCLARKIQPEVDFFLSELGALNDLIDKTIKKTDTSCL